jgi:hypothetical protein
MIHIWVTQFVEVFKKVRTVCGRTEGIDWLVEEIVLELMVVEGVFDVEAEVEAGVEVKVELEVVGAVEDLISELDDWTEEGVLDCTVAGLDDWEDADEAGVEEADESKQHQKFNSVVTKQ